MTPTPWWRWTLATVVIVFGWIYATAAITIGLADVGPDEDWFTLGRELLTFLPFLLLTALAWRYLLGRPFPTLINERGRIEPRRIALGFAVWFGLCAGTSAIDMLLHPGDFTVTFDAQAFALYALVALALLPVQTWAEELFFRGWVLRWAGGHPPITRVFISGVVFAMPHLGNPEAATDTWLALTAYFLLGAGWAWVSVRDGGIELAMGAHFANNAFSLLVVGYDNAALPTSALITTSSLNLLITTISIAVMLPVFARLTRRRTAV